MIEGHEQLKSYITSYYKGLFGDPIDSNLPMDESMTDGIPQVSEAENAFLTAPYTEEETKKEVFQLENNKAPGSDGFPTKFYQSFWNIFKDMLDLFMLSIVDNWRFFWINLGKIILLPKVYEAERIQQYRPVYLLNLCFKIFTKIVTIRLNSVADHVVRSTQSPFMQG
jgi:hypothetical protein